VSLHGIRYRKSFWHSYLTFQSVEDRSSGASGTGGGTVTYSVAANTGAARSGAVVVAGLSGVNPPATHQVTQAGTGVR
jgi:hypothetical protein